MGEKALIVVDVQQDFLETGALPVPGGGVAAHWIGAYARLHRGEYPLIVTSRDWHLDESSNGDHFSLAPDYVSTWPVHCVAGTRGSDYAPMMFGPVTGHEKKPSWADYEVLKGQGAPAYSAFEGLTAEGSRALEALLLDAGITEVEICGLAFDYCVKETALDAARRGFKTTVLLNLTASVSTMTAVLAGRDLALAGVRITKAELVEVS